MSTPLACGASSSSSLSMFTTTCCTLGFASSATLRRVTTTTFLHPGLCTSRCRMCPPTLPVAPSNIAVYSTFGTEGSEVNPPDLEASQRPTQVAFALTHPHLKYDSRMRISTAGRVSLALVLTPTILGAARVYAQTASQTYYLLESIMKTPDGRQIGVSVSLVRRTLQP